MPTYEYFCKKCGAEFEQFQSMTAAPLKICPECGQAAVERKISGGAGLIFKGSGFYITDYGGKKESKSAAAKSHPKTVTPAKRNAEKPITDSAGNTTEKPASK